MEIRDALDDAVRRLAVNPACLRERVVSAALALGKIGSEDFESEDRPAIDRIRLALMRLDLAEQSLDGAANLCPEGQEQALQLTASDILELREIAIRRAIEEARMSA